MYASFLGISEALHLDIFHQPFRSRFFDYLFSGLKSPWAKRHFLGGAENLPGALKDGAQSEGALRPCSATIELGLVSVWTACVRRRQGKGTPGRNRAQKAWFLAAPENPAQPTKRTCLAVSKG
jgi:hypothetical protein